MSIVSANVRQTLFFSASCMAVAMVAASVPAMAQSCPGVGTSLCEITVTQNDQTVQTQGNTAILNSASGTTVVQTAPDYLLLDNDGSIASLTLAQTQVPFDAGFFGPNGVTIVNSGQITGDVLFGGGRRTNIFVNEGGTVTGNVGVAPSNAFVTLSFINRSTNGTGVQGVLNPGNSIDFFLTSFADSGTYAVPASRPTNFEGGGVEVLGDATTVTIVNPQGVAQSNGIQLFGDGNVVIDATIDPISLTGSNIPPQAIIGRPSAIVYAGTVEDNNILVLQEFGPNGPINFQLAYGGGLESFTNDGVINGDIRLVTANFANNGDINVATADGGTVIQASADRAFSFENNAIVQIANTGDGNRPFTGLESSITLISAIDATLAAPVSISNDGQIGGGLTFYGIASEFNFVNDGEIRVALGDRAVNLEVGYFELAINEAMQGDIPASNATIINNGSLIGGIDAELTAINASFTNTGTIQSDPNDPYAQAVQVEMDDYASGPGADDDVDGESFVFSNSGSISGTAELELETTSVEITNSGSIAQGVVGALEGFTFLPAGFDGLRHEQETTLSGDLVLNNSGTISSADYGGVALSVEMEAGDLDSGLPAAANATATADITNSGTITASGGTFVTPGFVFGLNQNQSRLHVSTALAVQLDGEGGSSLILRNATGGTISNTPGPFLLGQENGTIVLQPGMVTGSAVVAEADSVTLINDGTISSGGGTVLTAGLENEFQFGDAVYSRADMEGVIGSGIDTFFSTDIITNNAGGVIQGGIALRQGNDTLDNFGSITGNIFMGTGNDRFTNSGTFAGNLQLGDGNDILVTPLANFATRFNGTGDGGNGVDSLIFTVGNGALIQDMAQAGLTNFEYIALGGVGEIASNGAATGPIQLALGQITLAAGNTVNASGEFAFLGDSPLSQNFTNRGVINGSVSLGVQNDVFANYGTLNGSLDLGEGDDSFTQGINAILTGSANGGAGTDTFILDITGGGTIDQTIYARLISFESLTTIGTGQVDVIGSDDPDEISNEGTLQGDVNLGAGDDRFVQSGTIEGDVDLGTGDDELVLQGDWAITGTVAGGEGFDSVSTSFTGTNDNYQTINLSGFQSFEELNVDGGVGALDGTATFDTFNVNDGRLVGLAGSTINGDVDVSQDGTFGSAGTVNGDVGVAGTLSPGASPGTMTVNGDVVLAASSTSVFEFTPTASDALIINGGLTIENGAELVLTGQRPFTPGIYNLVTTTQGITGQFAAGDISQAATVFGVLNFTPTAIQLLSTFQLAAGADAQSVATTAYLNALLIDGDATPGIIAAFPNLLTASGFADTAVLATISPEPYASSVQMGIENGLAISTALRGTQFAGTSEEGGLFVFGQALGNWRDLDAESNVGTASADIRTTAVLGGVGYGNQSFGVSAFVGTSDSRQRLSFIGARNDADGIFFGGKVHLAMNGFDAGATIVFDRADADTVRNPAVGGASASSSYSLHGTTFDAHLGYGFDMGGGWRIGPEVGVTYVSVKRGNLSETGGGAFALEVDSQRYDATFLDGAIKLSGAGEGAFQPWISAGVRHLADGDPIVATGGFTGTGASYVVTGAERDETLARVAGGFDYALSPAVSLFANGNVEFGDGNGSTHVNAGLRIGF